MYDSCTSERSSHRPAPAFCRTISEFEAYGEGIAYDLLFGASLLQLFAQPGQLSE